MLLYLISIAYFLAVNVYGFLLVKSGKERDETYDKKLFIAGILGGATAIYVGMFLYRYRTKNAFLMITLPLIIVLYGYLAFSLFFFPRLN